jgi:hypothetical protein
MSLLYFTPLLLYFPTLIPGVETQPLLAMGLAVYGLALGRFRRALVAFLCLAALLFLWITVTALFRDSPMRSVGLASILIGPLILFGALAQNAEPPSRRVLAVVAVYFATLVALEILMPESYRALASTLLSRTTVANGHRGITLFTPEPTYAAITSIYFLILAWWSGMRWGFKYRWIEPTLALCLLATGSTYVALLVLALAVVRWPRLMLLTVCVVISTIQVVGSISALDNDESIRAVVAVSRILATDFGDFLPSISIIDDSLGSRLITNIASFMTPIYSPLGLGLDCGVVADAFDNAGFDFAFNNPVLKDALDEGCLKPQSYLATITLGLGAISGVFILLLYFLTRYALGHLKQPIWLAPIAVAAMILIVQGQLTSPIPWILIFLALTGSPGSPKHRQSTLSTSEKVLPTT